MNKTVDPETFVVEKFVKYINANWRKNPEKYTKIVEKYFERTLKDGFMFVVRNPSFKERFLEKANNKICGIKMIESAFELQEFLMFNNPTYNKLAKPYVMNFLLNQFMENYYMGTLPCLMQDGGDYHQINSPSPLGKEMLNMTQLIIQSPKFFKPEEVKAFTNKFIEVCFNRKYKSPQKPFACSDIANICYAKTVGMYHFESEILYKMAKALAERGLDMSSVNKALEEFEFEEDLGDEGYIRLDKQASIFYNFKARTAYIAENPQEFRLAEYKEHSK